MLQALGCPPPFARTRHQHRILACEPYDEQARVLAIRELDASGRHGDARRQYRSYVERMAELELKPAPYPASIR